MAVPRFPLAVVTGGGHRLGRVFAEALAGRGYAILLHYHRSEDLAVATAAALRAGGVPAYLEQADLTVEADLGRLAGRAVSLGHELRVLVNSAAVMPHLGLEHTSTAEWDSVMALNLRTPFLLVQKLAGSMADGGLVVNVSDAGAGRTWKGYPAYSISKAALEVLTRLQAATYAPRLRVNALAPGLVLPKVDLPPADWERLVARTPLWRPTPPADLAAALVFLLANPSVTGQTIVVDGGFSLT